MTDAEPKSLEASLPGVEAFLCLDVATSAAPVIRFWRDAGVIELASIDDARSILQQTSGAVIVLYSNPTMAIARGIESASADTVRRQWERRIASLLDLYRGNRSRVQLVDGDAASADLGQLVAALQHVVLLDGATGTQDLARPLGTSLDTSQAHLLAVADAMLRWSPTANALAIELAASSIPPGPLFAEEIEALFQAHLNARGAEALQKKELEEENAVLSLQLAQVQEELAHWANASNNQPPVLRENPQLQQKIAQAKQELQWKQEDLDSIRSSLSWRITAPLRGLLSPFLGKSKL